MTRAKRLVMDPFWAFLIIGERSSAVYPKTQFGPVPKPRSVQVLVAATHTQVQTEQPNQIKKGVWGPKSRPKYFDTYKFIDPDLDPNFI